MSLEKFLGEIKIEIERIFPDASLVILEELPFYLKVRIKIDEAIFVEIRINERNGRQSYVLVKNGKRRAGFDNLGGWHLHPWGDPERHKRARPPSLRTVLRYFAEVLSK